MNKKRLLSNLLIGLLLVSGVGTYAYYRTKAIDKCDQRLSKYGENHACVSTSRGTMVFELYPTDGPKAVARFKSLANDKKFYDNLEFYRISKDFVAQAGLQDAQIKNTSVSNTSSKMQEMVKETENKFETESNFDKLNLSQETKDQLAQEGFTTNPNVDSKVFEFGSLAFANAGPNTNSTEFFIVSSKDKETTNVKYLRGRFTNFGKLIEGEDVLKNMNESELDKNYPYSQEKPADDIRIYEVRVK
jgi:peptidyl-prolyl cis-trans isomerase B (cyclophilin B)